MTTIFERVEAALATLSPAVPFAMGDYLGDLPDTYIVYTLIDGVPGQHADNIETIRNYRVQVSIMDVTGLVVLPNVDAVMTAAGFQKGPERPLPKDQDTSHYGLAKDYFFMSA